METVEILRSYRIEGFAIFDFAAALLGVSLILLMMGKFNIVTAVLLTVPLGVFSHKLFGIETPLGLIVDANPKLYHLIGILLVLGLINMV